MPPVGFEPTVSADERPQTYVLDRATTGTGTYSSQLNPGSGLRFVILLIHVDKYNQWLLHPLCLREDRNRILTARPRVQNRCC